MVRKRVLFFVIIFAASIVFPQSSVTQNEINSEFQIAVSLFEAQQYEEALKIFQWVTKQPENSKTTVSLLFSAKIFLQQKNFSASEETLRGFFELYPGSKYIGEAELLFAETLKEEGKAKAAVSFLVDNFSKYRDSYSSDRKRKIIAELLLENLTLEDVETLLQKNVERELEPSILLALVQKNTALNNLDAAKLVYNKLLKEYPNQSETSSAAGIINAAPLKATETSAQKIVCMLPITDNSGAENQAAKDVLEGIKYAVHEFNSLAENKFALVIKDTRRDSIRICNLAKELEQDSDYSAVIGPVFSDETKIFLNSSIKVNRPVISPTANEENLQSEGVPFYQANTSIETHGKALAQYIFFVENKRSMAIIFPQSGNANVIGRNFIAEFKSLGGKITQQTYPSKIRSAESLILNLTKERKEVEGIFLPLNEQRLIPLLLSALVKHGIDLPIYGNQDWFTTKGLETSSSLSERLTFASDSFIDFQDEDVKTFSQKYFEVTGEEIAANNFYGYDAAKYLLRILTTAERVGKTYEETFSSAEPFEGIHNSILFEKSTINSFVNIVRFHQGKFELVERFKYKPKAGK